MTARNDKEGKITWLNFLHLYQPANADSFIIKEATKMSYSRIIKALKKRPQIRFTMNITGCLIERWAELGYIDLINDIKQLAEHDQIELVGSAAYHALLPLVPQEEAKLQIKENERILKKYFGDKIKLHGFFCPEMAYSHPIGKLIKSLGYKWIILDEISHTGRMNSIDYRKVYQDKASGLKAIFRSRALSSSYIPDELVRLIEKDAPITQPLITATDGELYGLRHNDPTGKLEELLDSEKLVTKIFSDYIFAAPEVVETNLVSSSWDSTEDELAQGKPYFIWKDSDNKIQIELWKLAQLAWRAHKRFSKDENIFWSRWHLVRGLASCTFWWASGRDFRHIYGPLAWNPDQVELGVNELARSIRALEDCSTRSIKIKAEKHSIRIKQMIWRKHWEVHWKS